jgi:sarcosine oxidase
MGPVVTERYDAIVIGLGGMGSAAAWHLAKRGKRVLGLEAFGINHANGSSHGEHRIIRQAYFEAPEYVPLILRAYELWDELEQESGRDLLRITGGLLLGDEQSEVVTGSIASARQHSLAYEVLQPDDVRKRFPGFHLPEGLVAVYEPHAGYLRPEECVAAHVELASRHGADIHTEEPVTGWEADADGVTVTTGKGQYRADSLVIAAGPWTDELLGDLNLPLTVIRIVNAHFRSTDPATFAEEQCPVYIWEVPEGTYYGFPSMPESGLKLGRHDRHDPTTARTIDREVQEHEVEELRAMLDRYMPGASGDVIKTLTCMYTITPDLHFILDQHPEYPHVAFGCGFSGHGYKFASVIGEVLAELAADGTTGHPIEFFSAARFASQSG